MAVTRGSGSSAGETHAGTGRASGSPAGTSMGERIGKAIGPAVRVLSAKYIGRDHNGRPMYHIRYNVGAAGARIAAGAGRHSGRVSTISKTVTFQGGKVDRPFLKGKADTGGGGQAGGSGAGLDAAKERWFNIIAKSGFADATKRNMIRNVERWTGSVQGLDQHMRNLVRMPRQPVVAEAGPGEDDFFDLDSLLGGLGGGGGGGGGFAGPEYVAPDRRVVEDMAKGMLTSLVGGVDDQQVNALADLYMKDHRRNFDATTEEIDPAQSMLEAIRDSETYREIHALRPDTEDERSWISDRLSAAKRGGLSTARQQEFAVTQATVAGDVADAEFGASVQEFQATGQSQGTHLESRLRDSVANLYRGVTI